MKFTKKDIAIVILNWNGKDLLAQFLPSIVSFSEGASIYVADNASTDNSVQFLNLEYPDVKIIKNIKNGGFAKGYNDALKSVDEPLLCLLNSDVEVTKGWLTAILDTFNSDKDTAIIQPKLLDYKKKTHFEYAGAAGGFMDKYGYPYCRGRIFDTIEKDIGQYNDTINMYWASGACFFIKNDVFKALGGLDETFFAHMEEIDLCWRAFNKNYKIKYIGSSTVYHVGGATLQAANPKKTYLNFRNSLFTLTKNTDRNVIGRVFIRMLLDGVAALRFFGQLKPIHSLSILKAHFSFYKALPRLIKQRRLQPSKKKYYDIRSIVWRYFVQHNKTF